MNWIGSSTPVETWVQEKPWWKIAGWLARPKPNEHQRKVALLIYWSNYSKKTIPSQMFVFFISIVSVQRTKDKHTTDRLLQGDPYISFIIYFDIQKQSVDSSCSPLHSMPPLLGAGLLHCRVLVFFLPLQEDHSAQQLQLPSMAMAAGPSSALRHLWQCVWPFRFPKNSREMTSWGVCSGVHGWWVRTFEPLSHLAGPPTVADWTHAVTPGAWRERLAERMNILSVWLDSIKSVS